MKIIELEEVDSTNEYCKRLNCGCDVAVTAKKQTAGKGTKGRSFYSSEGGLYISVMRHYSDFSAADAFRIMINSCVAVCETVEFYGLKPIIRWANDVLVDGKKICGTLIENTVRGGKIIKSIVGIGLNVNNELPPSLDDIATTMQALLKRDISVEEVKQTFLNNLEKNYSVRDYKRYIDWFGSNVELNLNGCAVVTEAIDIDDYGRLVCKIDGKMQKISSAEVSLRLK